MTFEAKWDGTCKICGEMFYEGEEIGYVDDDIACEECVWEDMDECDEGNVY